MNQTIHSNLAVVLDNMGIAAEKSGRNLQDITLVAVSKFVKPEHIGLYHICAVLLPEQRLSRVRMILGRAKEYSGISRCTPYLCLGKTTLMCPLTETPAGLSIKVHKGYESEGGSGSGFGLPPLL